MKRLKDTGPFAMRYGSIPHHDWVTVHAEGSRPVVTFSKVANGEEMSVSDSLYAFVCELSKYMPNSPLASLAVFEGDTGYWNSLM
jgi:hypothetical protein